ncbi:MAG: hypothetical protein AAF574_01840 [Pseudomonadota bacterium]
MSLAWALFALYLVGTAWLGWVGYRKTRGFGSFAIGGGDLSPLVVGITLAASTASAATFIINPGFVYVDGLGAWFHMVVGLGIGFCTMLYFLSFRFRRIGAESGALTIPDWIGKRYGSPGYALFFSILTLLSFAFVVLLVGGISIVMQPLLGVSNAVALAITLVFVTGYVFIGGTYAHVLTNMLQGTLMIGVTLLVLGSIVTIATADGPGLFERLRDVEPTLLMAVNPDGALFNNVFSNYVAGFVIGAVVVCQPHILTKALYVKDDRAVRQYLTVFTVVFALFLLLVTVGFLAHLVVPDSALIDPATGAFRQDLVMTAYLQTMFPEWMFTIIAVVLLAAAMSTLDGLLVSLSTITANDLVLNVLPKRLRDGLDEAGRMKLAMRASHVVLVVIAVAAYRINLNPPRLLGVFGQVGVYGLAVAATPPLIAGVLARRPSVAAACAASLGALLIHFGLYGYGATWFPNSSLAFANPGVTAAIAALIVVPPLLLASGIGQRGAA